MDTNPREDIENNIRKLYKLVKDYDETLMYSSNPKEKVRAQQGITVQTENIKNEFGIYFRFDKDVTTKIPDDIRDIASYFNINLPINQVIEKDELVKDSNSQLGPPAPKPVDEVKILRPKWIDNTIIVAIITLIGVIITSQGFTTWFTTITNNPTPVLSTSTPIPFARIISLDIMENGNIIETVYPKEKKVLPPSQNLFLKLNVNTNTGFNDLIFTWEFCHPEKNLKGQDAGEIPYTLSAREVDCITVTIMKGGERLNTANFFISGE